MEVTREQLWTIKNAIRLIEVQASVQGLTDAQRIENMHDNAKKANVLVLELLKESN
jgi:hypothetical protein